VKSKKSEKQPNKVDKWYLLNAQDKVLGKIAAEAAKLLLGKNDPTLKSYDLPKARVVVINAAKVSVSGRKEEDKKYYRYSGYPGGLREKTLAQLREQKPNEIIAHAVNGMLPKNRKGKELRRHLFVYPGSTHPHEAQKLEIQEV
jgi:large subunit ribosomal protein L13